MVSDWIQKKCYFLIFFVEKIRFFVEKYIKKGYVDTIAILFN